MQKSGRILNGKGELRIIKNDNNSIVISDEGYGEGFPGTRMVVSDRGVSIGGNVSNSIIVTGDSKVYQDGVVIHRRGVSTQSVSGFAGLTREIVLLVPNTDLPTYNVEVGIGNVEIEGTKGRRCVVSIKNGNIKISDYTGEKNTDLEIENGRADITGFKGNLSANVQNGNVNVADFDGILDLLVHIGNIRLKNAHLQPDSEFKTKIGTIRYE